MPIIDFHTHTFPDAIAEKTIATLSAKSRTKAFLSSKADDLSEDGKREGIVLSVILPVVTNPLKTDKINTASALINEKTQETGLFSFGGMHPDTPEPKEEIRRIARLGLKGIKIHPPYQGVPLNDIRYKRIVDYAEEEGLVVVSHGGIDIGVAGDWSNPKQCLELLREVRPTKFVMAHMGGWQQWDEVEELLAGEDLYFDTAFSYGEYAYSDDVPKERRAKALSEEKMVSLVRLHGADKILFGTDSPWTDRREQAERIEALPLTQQEKDSILFLNAQKLLGLQEKI